MCTVMSEGESVQEHGISFCKVDCVLHLAGPRSPAYE